MPTSSAPWRRWRRASTCRRTGSPSTRSARTRPANITSAPRTRSPNFETAFYRSTTADNASFEQWSEEGARDAAQRANAIWKSELAAYEAPPIDDAIDAELTDFVARRRAELPDEFG